MARRSPKRLADCESEVVTARLTCDQVSWLRGLGHRGLSGAVRGVVASEMARRAQEDDSVAEVPEHPAVGHDKVDGGTDHLGAEVGVGVNGTDVGLRAAKRRGATRTHDAMSSEGSNGDRHE